ncbi:MAG: lytic transglycosylase domain-containing protein [Catenulispora sp.]|nr:lytic transglycosylase domain-containing protein [Catenulispora sp.]
MGLGINATPAQAQAIAKQLVPSGQYACFANIISRESSWNIHATNASSGAYGLPQALPGSKMAEYGSDWRNSATIQIKWALAYMTGRYGSPCAAWTFWQNHSWY